MYVRNNSTYIFLQSPLGFIVVQTIAVATQQQMSQKTEFVFLKTKNPSLQVHFGHFVATTALVLSPITKTVVFLTCRNRNFEIEFHSIQ